MRRAAAFAVWAALSFAQPKSPEQTFGFKMGEDRKLVKWPQIVDYFHALAGSSNKVKIIEAGKTSEGNPMIVAAISSPENLARLDRIREVSGRLAHPRGLNPEEAEKLIAEEKLLVAVSCSIHASEVAATQLSMELAYDLVTKDTPQIRRILDQDVVLLWPSHNPDGNITVVDWYNKNVGTKYENAPLPWLYHKYVGHDNNRDWFMLNLDETKVVTKFYFQDWFPPVLYDIHQMGRTGARLFVPPFLDPLNPNIHPLIWRGINLLGTHMAEAEEEAGHSGVAQNILYTSWWQGNSLQQPWFHNMVSVLTEAASPNVASPVTQKLSELTGNTPGLNEYALRENFSHPWPGGTWRLRDVVEYEYTAAMAVLDTAARYREDFLRNFYNMGREEIRRGETEAPYAYVVSATQRDPNTAVKMINLLIDQGAEIQRANSDFTADGVKYPKSSYVILMAQPFRPFVKDIMEPQRYPDIRAFPGGPPVPPYDVAGWTLPLQMGVSSALIKNRFEASLAPVTRAEPPSPEIAAGGAKTSAFLIGHEENDSLIAVNRLLKGGNDVYWSQSGFTSGSKQFAPGTIVVPASGAKQEQVKRIAQSLSLPLAAADGSLRVAAYKLKPLRLALFNPWGGNMDEGWTKLMLERFEFPFEEIRPADVRSGQFKQRFDVVVFSDQQPASILEGIPADRIQPEYAGGIGQEGLEHVREFVRNGGTVVALGNASELFIKPWGLPIVDAVAGMKTTDFFCPGSILDVRVDTSHPAGFGMPEKASGFFARSSAFEPRPSTFAPGGQVRTIVKYASDHVLESGWILGENHLYDRAAAVDVTLEKGHLILFGFRVQNRAQPHGTFKLFFNSLYYGPAELSQFRAGTE